MSNFVLYLFGAILVTAGFAWAAFQLGVAPVWIGIGAVIIIGFGIMAGVSKTRRKEKPDTEN